MRETRPTHGDIPAVPLRRLAQPWTWMAFVAVASIGMSVLVVASPKVMADGAPAVVYITGPNRPPGFSPSILTIYADTSVTFINDAYPSASFTIVAKDGTFRSPAIAPGQQWTMTVSAIGNHEYVADAAPIRIVGDLIVVDAAATLIPTPNPTAEAALVRQIKSAQAAPKSAQPQAAPGASSPFWLGTWWVVGAIVLLVVGIVATSALFITRSKRPHP